MQEGSSEECRSLWQTYLRRGGTFGVCGGQHEWQEMSLRRDAPRKIAYSVLSEGYVTCVLS